MRSRYFRRRNDLGFYNVGTPAVRALGKAIAREHRRRWTVDDALAFADILIATAHLEVKALGIEVLACYRREFTPQLLARMEALARGRPLGQLGDDRHDLRVAHQSAASRAS